jgi:hypothetical protein
MFRPWTGFLPYTQMKLMNSPGSTQTREPNPFGISAKMARALADTWRFRILVETTVRPLSPSEFVDRFGGDLGHISRCFRQLEDWGYLQRVEERPGRKRATALEHVYRAARQARFDTSIWEQIPQPARNAVSYSVLSSYFQRARTALEAGTFDAEVDRHLSWDIVALDRIAWKQASDRLDEVLDSGEQLELHSSERLEASGGEAIPTILGLASFRSPKDPAQILEAPRRHLGPTDTTINGASYGIDAKLAKALTNKWRCQILMEATVRPLSVSLFVEEVGGTIGNIARHFRKLAAWGYLDLVEERRGGRHGGGTEKWYRSACRAFFDTATWETLPLVFREEISEYFLESYMSIVVEALETGTFDAKPDRHLSWQPLVLDRPAWQELGVGLDKVLNCLPQWESESVARTEGKSELLIPTVVGLAAFRSPEP